MRIASTLLLVCTLLVNGFSQTESIKENPNWNRDSDWTMGAPGTNTIQDATLVNNGRINDEPLTVNDHVIISTSVEFITLKEVIVEDGGLLQIDGFMEMKGELFEIREGGKVLICGTLIGTMNNGGLAVNAGEVEVKDGGTLDWRGDWCSEEGANIIIDGTLEVADEFKNSACIDGNGTIIIEDELDNQPPGKLFGCEEPGDGCCEFVDGRCYLPGIGAGTPVHISVASGNWSDPSTWDVNDVPGVGDEVVISEGNNVTLESGGAPELANLTIETNATLLQNDIDILVTGDYIMNNFHRVRNAVLELSGAGTSFQAISSDSSFASITLEGAEAQLLINGDKTFSNDSKLVVFSAGATNGITLNGLMTNQGDFQMATPVSGAGIWFNDEFSRLRIFATDFPIPLDASGIGNTVLYQDIIDQSVVGTTNGSYYNLVIGGNQPKVMAADITVVNTLFMTGTLDASPNNYQLTLQGEWGIDGGTFLARQGKVVIADGLEAIRLIESTNPNLVLYDLEIDAGLDYIIADEMLLIQVVNNLTLTSGGINLPPTSEVILGTGIDNTGTLNYVNGAIYGKLTRWINNAAIGVLYPVGIYPVPHTLDFSSTDNSAGQLSVNCINEDPGNGGSPWQEEQFIYVDTYSDGFWELTSRSNITVKSYDVILNFGNMEGYSFASQGGGERVLYRADDSQPWQFIGEHGGATSITSTRNGLDALGSLAIASDNDCVIPDPPVAIVNNDVVCPGAQGVVYDAVAPVPTPGNGYVWEALGGEIVSGQGTVQATVNWDSTTTVGVLSVRAIAFDCGLSGPYSQEFPLGAAPTSNITGPTVVPVNGISQYSVENNLGYNYTWTITGGTQISGGNTSSIEVEWGNAGAGVIRVDATPPGNCPTADPVFLDVVIFSTFTSQRSGDWTDPSTWIGNAVPTTGSDVLVSIGDVVTLDADPTVSTLTVNGTLRHTGTGDHEMVVFNELQVTGTYEATRPGDNILLRNLVGLGIVGGSGTIDATSISIAEGIWELPMQSSLTVDAESFEISSIATLEVRGALNVANDISRQVGGQFKCSFTGSTVTFAKEGEALDTEQAILPPDDAFFNLTLQGATSKTTSADIRVDGNLTINGGEVDLEDQELILTGVNTQIINGENNIRVSDIEIDNVSIGTGVSVQQNLLINGSLILTTGVVDVADGLEIRVTSTGDNTPGNQSSYVQGKFTCEVGSPNFDYAFPVGGGGRYAPAVINPASFLSGDRVYSVSYFPTGFENQTPDGTFQIVSPNEYWDIIDADNTGADEVRLYYSEQSNINNPATALVARYNALTMVWNQAGTGSSSGSDPLGDFISAQTVTEFSPFTFGSLNDENLPVTLLAFKARAIDDRSARVQWSTATELNNEKFVLQHSRDGVNFETINETQGLGTSSTGKEYEFVHKNLQPGTHFYRLTQVDYDGRNTRHGIVSVLLRDDSRKLVAITPNPVSDGLIRFDLSQDLQGEGTLQVFDIQGRLLINREFEQLFKGTHTLNSNLLPGTYVLRMQVNAIVVSEEKVIVTGN